MNILATSYTLKYKSFDIYVAGCSGVNGVHCTNCHNPESWNFNQGDLYDEKYFNNIKNKIIDFDSMIDNIMIFGGEPLNQKHEELIKMLSELKSIKKKIWLFTRYEICDIPNNIKILCDYIKTGCYDENYKTDKNICYGINLTTSNQKIYSREEFLSDNFKS